MPGIRVSSVVLYRTNKKDDRLFAAKPLSDQSISLDGELTDAKMTQLAKKALDAGWEIDPNTVRYDTIESGSYDPKTDRYKDRATGEDMRDFNYWYSVHKANNVALRPASPAVQA